MDKNLNGDILHVITVHKANYLDACKAMCDIMAFLFASNEHTSLADMEFLFQHSLRDLMREKYRAYENMLNEYDNIHEDNP